MGRPRHFEKPGEWRDFYRPTDYFGLASSFAKTFCKEHPEADKNIVYGAAADAAFEYDSSRALQRYKFKIYVNVKIRNAILNNKRKEKEMVSSEERAEMIAERKAGMSYGQIAIKHNRNKNSVESNLTNWKRAGLFDDENETSSEQVQEEESRILPDPAETVKKLEEAGVEPVECDGTKIYTMKGVDFPVELCEAKRPELWDEIAWEIADFAAGILGAGTVNIVRTSNEERQFARAILRTADGKKVKIKMEVV